MTRCYSKVRLFEHSKFHVSVYYMVNFLHYDNMLLMICSCLYDISIFVGVPKDEENEEVEHDDADKSPSTELYSYVLFTIVPI